MPAIPQKTLDEFVDDFLATIEAETGVAIDTRVGSAFRALANAATTNDMYLQSQILQVSGASRLDTAIGDDLDSFVAQFSPPFTTRILAAQASQAAPAPTELLSAATASYLHVEVTQKLYAEQNLQLLNEDSETQCTVDIVEVEPEIQLTATAEAGDTILTTNTTNGVFAGGVLRLVDGIYSAEAAVVGVIDGTHIEVEALASVLSHTFAIATTDISLLGVLEVTNYTFDGPAVLGDFAAGTVVRPVDMLEGVVFSRTLPDGVDVEIPIGTIVQTEVDAVQYEVVEDENNLSYDSEAEVYIMQAGTDSVSVKVQAVLAGLAYNVAANTLTVLPTAITGVDSVTNPYAISNGCEQESDALLRERFRDFISSNRGSGSHTGIEAAIEAVSTDIQFSVLENVAADGLTAQPGHFLILISDIQGNLTAELLEAVNAAVEANRPLTTTYTILPPAIDTPTIVFDIAVDLTAYTLAERITTVKNSMVSYFANLAAGEGWNFNRVIALVMDTPGVEQLTKLTIDGDGFDETSGTYVVVGDGPVNGSVGVLVLCRPTVANITGS